MELISFSITGQVLARRAWQSTFPFVTLKSAQVAETQGDDILIHDKSLQTVQAISLSSVPHISIQLQLANPPTAAAYPGYAKPPRVFQLEGVPVHLSEIPKSAVVVTLQDGNTVEWSNPQLRRIWEGKVVKTYDLSWLTHCNGLCQAWTGTQLVGIVPGRALLVSKGSKFPLTDTGGLFPFTRILLLDLNSGQPLFEREYYTDQSDRAAALDFTGRLLAISDKTNLSVYSVPQSTN